MRLFVIPQCNNETVSIAQEYLDRAPESVLAIAAQRAPTDKTISLKDWPDANVAVLQVGARAVLQQKDVWGQRAPIHSLLTSLLMKLLLLKNVLHMQELYLRRHTYIHAAAGCHQLPI